MPYKLVFRAIDNPIAPDDMRYRQKGDLMGIFPDGWDWGVDDLTNNVAVTVSNGSPSQAAAFLGGWQTSLNYQISALDQAQDLWHVVMQANNARVSDGLGKLDAQHVDMLISGWSLSGVESSPGVIEFDVSVLDAMTSPFFLQGDVSQVVFSEQAYDETSGEHTIMADYSATAYAPNVVASRVHNVSELLSHDKVNKQIIYKASRADVLEDFKRWVVDKFEAKLAKSRFRISASSVDAIISAGGEVTRTQAQVEAVLIDRAAE